MHQEWFLLSGGFLDRIIEFQKTHILRFRSQKLQECALYRCPQVNILHASDLVQNQIDLEFGKCFVDDISCLGEMLEKIEEFPHVADLI